MADVASESSNESLRLKFADPGEHKVTKVVLVKCAACGILRRDREVSLSVACPVIIVSGENPIHERSDHPFVGPEELCAVGG